MYIIFGLVCTKDNTMSQSSIRTLIRSFNMFGFDSFWKSNGHRSYSSICGSLVSLPMLIIIFIVLVLKIIQMAQYGIVMTSTQVNFSNEPTISTVSTFQNDSSYAPFMLAFSVNIDASSCPNSILPFQVYSIESKSSSGSSNRTTSKVPVTFQSCTYAHFSMLPGQLDKLKQWTNNTLKCLPLNSYLQFGGSSLSSNLYKSIQLKLSCPSSCSISSCGTVELFSASATVNLGNSSSPYSYGLTRHVFSVDSAPKYKISYQLDSTNMTSDNSVLPFSANAFSSSTSVGNVFTDILTSAGDSSTYITIQRSDKSTLYQRSYYKVFDLLAYLGGMVYGIILLLFFLRNLSRVEFELNFAAEYFRISDSREISFRGYFKQMIYEMLKSTRWKPDWRMAEVREEAREAANKVLDVVYLNKRIAFLEEAISLLFDKHQLKGIHLLHTLSKQQLQTSIDAYHFRDRVVYYLGLKYRHLKNPKYSQIKDSDEMKLREAEGEERGSKYKQEVNLSDSSKRINQLQLDDEPQKNTDVQYLQVPNAYQNSGAILNQRPKKLTLRNLISRQKQLTQRRVPSNSEDSFIINEAQEYYSELAQEERRRNIMVVNSPDDNQHLSTEVGFIGCLTPEELHEQLLQEQLKNDIKQLIDEGQKKDGNPITKKIYERLDRWLKNYLWDTIKKPKPL